MDQFNRWAVSESDPAQILRDGEVQFSVSPPCRDNAAQWLVLLLNEREKMREIIERTLKAGEEGRIQGLYGPLHWAMTQMVKSGSEGRLSLFSPVVNANLHSDDRLMEVSFKANDYFESASDEMLLELAASGWGGCEESDAVARDAESAGNVSVCAIMDYVRSTRDRRNAVGFECYVNEDEAMRWIRQHRPWLTQRIENLLHEHA